ncbi:MAG: hypothetical protein ACRDHZ_00250 [Ktedonobacteraceae bacterium]
MAATTKPRGTWIERALDTEKLDVINDIWQFLLSLVEIIVDIAMFICSIYLILSFGVPAMSNESIITLSLAVMIAAPELLLPGGFMKSAQLRVSGNSKGWPLTLICWCFLLLTIVTVGSVVYQLDEQTAKVLVVIRCGLGIAYGILSIIAYREEKAKRKEQLAIVQAVPELFAPYLQQLQQSNQTALTQMRELLTRDNQEKLTQMRELLTRDNQEFLTRMEGLNQIALTPLSEKLLTTNEEILTSIMGQAEQSNQQALAVFIDQIRNENEAVLQRAVEQLEQASDRKVGSALTRIERVRVILDNTATPPSLTSGRGQMKLIEGAKIVDAEGQNRRVNDAFVGGQEGESSGVKAQRFIATYLAAEGSLPRVKTVMDATGCVKNTARKYLKLAGSTEQDED